MLVTTTLTPMAETIACILSGSILGTAIAIAVDHFSLVKKIKK